MRLLADPDRADDRIQQVVQHNAPSCHVPQGRVNFTAHIGGGMLANEFIRLPYQFMGQVPTWVPRWGHAHKDFVRQAYKRTIVIMGPVQESRSSIRPGRLTLK